MFIQNLWLGYLEYGFWFTTQAQHPPLGVLAHAQGGGMGIKTYLSQVCCEFLSIVFH
jgi:hypothetical protein